MVSMRALPVLSTRLSSVVDLIIPGFERAVPQGMVRQHMFGTDDTRALYERFRTDVLRAVGHHYLPVCRLSDGEFYFALGYRPPPAPPGANAIIHYLRKQAGAWRVGRRPWRFKSGAPKYGWEEFAWREWRAMRREFASYLAKIAAAGIVAVNFTRTNPPFAEQYIEPFCDWLDHQQISIHEGNYVPFYFVYALLNGPDAGALLGARNVLVVSSFDHVKKRAVVERLKDLGARSVQFLDVSRQKAIADCIDPSELRHEFDVALVAAGVGAGKMLWQLRNSKAVCLDAGFCLEIMADDSRRSNRVFCVPDSTTSGSGN